MGDLPLSSEPFASKCLTFYPADVFEIKMKGVFPLTTSISRKLPQVFAVLHKIRIAGEQQRLSKEIQGTGRKNVAW